MKCPSKFIPPHPARPRIQVFHFVVAAIRFNLALSAGSSIGAECGSLAAEVVGPIVFRMVGHLIAVGYRDKVPPA